MGVGMDEAEGAADMFYDIPNRSCEFALLESGVPRGYWRAVNTTHTVFAVESMIDELARRASRDPLEYRLALIDKVRVDKPPQSVRFPFNPDRMKAVLRLAGEKAGWGGGLPAGHAQGVACSYDHVTYVAEVVELSVARGALQVHRVVCAADAGPIVNPLGARAQVEGAITQGLSAVLHERITISGAAVEQDNFDRYRLLRVNEAPGRIEVHFIETDTPPTGLGEPALPPLGPAVANAIHEATGRRLRSLPLGPQLGSAG